jgi:D-xylose transport system ATP-binding protein
MPTAVPILNLQQIRKTFPGVVALDSVDLSVYPGEVHAICGENGAGKSTLMKVLSGVYPHGTFAGSITYNNKDVQLHSLAEARSAGIALVHQELALLPELSVLDNLFLGQEPRSIWGTIDRRQQQEQALQHFANLNLDLPLYARVHSLSIGQQQRLEIARALLSNPQVLVLDEPTSALPEDDAQQLLEWIRNLAEQGTACLYISHRMDEVFAISQRITVLRDGHSIWSKAAAEVSESDVIRAMVDRPLDQLFPYRTRPLGKRALQVDQLQVRKSGKPILQLEHFSIRAGEIIGLAGMMGSGRSCFMMSLVGGLTGCHATGTLHCPSQTDDLVSSPMPASPQQARQAGVFMIPEDRKNQALLLNDRIIDNMLLANMTDYGHLTGLQQAAMHRDARTGMDGFRIKAPSYSSRAGQLSGGNQQKILLARAALAAPRVLLLDEPTRGIDVGAKADVYQHMLTWAEQGWAIIWCSSEMPELLGISDRILVFADGQAHPDLLERPFSQEHVMHLASQPPSVVSA